jgi:hypothetical protein
LFALANHAKVGEASTSEISVGSGTVLEIGVLEIGVLEIGDAGRTDDKGVTGGFDRGIDDGIEGTIVIGGVDVGIDECGAIRESAGGGGGRAGGCTMGTIALEIGGCHGWGSL